MSTMHTGRTPPPGKIEIDGAVGVNIDSSFMGSAFDTSKMVAEDVSTVIHSGVEPDVSADELQTLGSMVTAASLFTPVPVFQGGIRVGLAQHLEAGAMLHSSGWGAHLKYQLMDVTREQPFDLAVALQVQRQGLDVPIPDFLKDIFSIEDFSRTDLIVPVAISRELSKYGFVYGGAKGFRSSIQADLMERISDIAGQPAVVSGAMWGGGPFMGAGLGYRYVFVTAELNFVSYAYHPVFLGSELDFTGMDFYPAIGLQIRPYRQGGRHPG